MSQITVQLETRVQSSFRVEQVAGMFDVALEERTLIDHAAHGARLSQREREVLVKHALTAEVPGVDEAWTIGAIVGPSGSGKTTLARAAFGGAVYKAREWPRERAIIDVVGEAREGACESGRADGRHDACATVKEIARVFIGVGLGSVWTWLKPYHVLSGGERFRAELARALLGGGSLTQRHRGTEERGEFKVEGQASEVGGQRSEVGKCGVVVMDEFTSSLDRTVAKTTSAAVAKLLRGQGSGAGSQGPGANGQASCRFVAVTCHKDILLWLAPDWVLELGGAGVSPRLTRERRPRPEIRLIVDRVPQAMWRRFAEQHYLSGGLAASATCYTAWCEGEGGVRESEIGRRETKGVGGMEMEGENFRSRSERTTFERTTLVAFCAVVATLGWKKTKHITRLVTLPEFQGMGIGGRLLDEVAEVESRRGFRVTITASHPAIVAHCTQSVKWSYTGVKKTGSTRQRYAGREIRSSMGRAVAGFEYRGQ